MKKVHYLLRGVRNAAFVAILFCAVVATAGNGREELYFQYAQRWRDLVRIVGEDPTPLEQIVTQRAALEKAVQIMATSSDTVTVRRAREAGFPVDRFEGAENAR